MTKQTAEQHIEEVCKLLNETVQKAFAFYDARYVAYALCGLTGANLDMLRQAKVFTDEQVAEQIGALMRGAFANDGRVPKVIQVERPDTEAKQ